VQPALNSCRLSRRDDLGAGYFVLWFEGDTPVDAPAGTFAMVRSEAWGLAPLLPRPMSMLTGGDNPSILIKVVGEGTRRMAAAAIGERFTLHAPLGHPWSLPTEGQQPLLVAGGVGVAPLVYLARTLSSQDRDVVTLYGGRTKDDLPLSEALEEAGRLGVTTEDGSRGTEGRITVLLEKELEERKDKAIATRIYCCGPHPMMAAVAAMAKRFGVACDASLEAPMGCGYGVCLGCPVARAGGGYLYTCVDGPCVDATTVDWSVNVF
jgi:dihydroorotate dehydrogenase electron transfer subunit